MSENENRPANIRFGEEKPSHEQGYDQVGKDDLLDKDDAPFEDEEEEERPQKPKKKAKGLSPLILWSAIGLGLVVVLGGILIIVGAKNRHRGDEYAETTSAQGVQAAAAPQQPVIVPPQAPAPEQSLPAAGQVVSAPEQSAPVQAGVGNAQPVLSQMVQPDPGATVNQPGGSDRSQDVAKISEQIKKISLVVDGLNEKIARVEKQIEAIQKVRPAAAATSSPKEDHPLRLKEVKHSEASAAAKKEQKAKPLKTETAGKNQKQTKPAEPSPAAKEEPRQTSVGKVDSSDYTLSTLIGSRAWLTKRKADGTDVEISVTVGERLEGVRVSTIERESKCVILESGQRICARR